MKRKPVKNSLRLKALLVCAVILFSVLAPLSAAFAAGSDQTGNNDILRNMLLSYLPKGGDELVPLIEEDGSITVGDLTQIEKFHLLYSFELEDNLDGESNSHRTMHENDFFYVPLPKEFSLLNPVGGAILGNRGETLANVAFSKNAEDAWQMQITFTDYIDNLNEYEIHGQVEVYFNLDLSGVGDGDETTISIPIGNGKEIELEVTKPEPPETQPKSLVKSHATYNNANRLLTWTVKMEPATGDFSGSTFTDTIDIENLTLLRVYHGTRLLIQGEDYQFSDDGTITYLIPAGSEGAAYQDIYIETQVKQTVYGKHTATVIDNKAYLKRADDGSVLESNQDTQTITPDWLKKSGQLIEGNRIKWKITANTTRQWMYNAVITDKLQADVVLDTTSLMLDDTTPITVHTNLAYQPASADEVYAILKTNGDGTHDLDIYLPRGIDKASNATRVITLVTDVVKPSTVLPAAPKYTNEASLRADYLTGDGVGGSLPNLNIETEGIPVPYVTVAKKARDLTADDLRNGTITWDFSVAGNLANYGKTVITDTLPEGQTFLADKIFHGATQLTSSTTPSAVLSNGNRTLTITFSAGNAVHTQQKFTVTSKIDADVYGQNINGQYFTNKVNADLYAVDDNNPDTVEGIVATNNVTARISVTNKVIVKEAAEYEGNVNSECENPTMDFTITINQNKMPLTGVTVSDDLSLLNTYFKKAGTNDYVAVTPKPAWHFVPGSMVITKVSGSRDSLNLTQIAASATYVGQLLTVSFGASVQVNDTYKIKFTVSMDADQSPVFKDNGEIKATGNVGAIEAGGLKPGKITTSPTDGVPVIKNEVMGKTAIYAQEDQQLHWFINLNQHRIILKNTRVEDVLQKGLALDPTSLRLYTNVIDANGKFYATMEDIFEKGTRVENFEFTYLPVLDDPEHEGAYKLTVTLPSNETDYILYFATDVDQKLVGSKVSNNANFVGEDKTDDNSGSFEMVISGSATGGSVTKTYVTVYKKNNDNGALLNGAEFSLYWLADGTWASRVFMRNQTAAENGQTIFRGLSRGQTYAIQEVTPPAGFVIDDSAPKVFLAPPYEEGDALPLTYYNSQEKAGSWSPAALKTLTGKTLGRSFSFIITNGEKPVMHGVSGTQLTGGAASVAFTLAENVQAKDVLNFKNTHVFARETAEGTRYLAETRRFYLSEVNTGIGGYNYDDAVFQLVVKAYNVMGRATLLVEIEDELGNLLASDGAYQSGKTPTFENGYEAEGSLILDVTKHLTGRALAENTFWFELYENGELKEAIQNTAGEQNLNGSYSAVMQFAPLLYTHEDVGTKTYVIKERKEALGGYTYDESEYTVTVAITDNDNGTVSTRITGIQKTLGESTEEAEIIAFNNTYRAENTQAHLEAQKTLVGRTLEEAQFTFLLERLSDQGETEVTYAPAQNDLSGLVRFEDLTFTHEDIGKTYTYVITEQQETLGGYTFDESVFHAYITVNDNGDGTLSTQIAYAEIVEEETIPAPEGAQFENLYRASGSLPVSGTKTLENHTLVGGKFSFTLSNAEGILQTVQNTAGGDILFENLSFTQDMLGEHVFYIHEVNTGEEYYVFDTTVYVLTVTVEDNGDGTLNIQSALAAQTDGGTEAREAISFVNTYVPPPDTGDVSPYALYALLVLAGLALAAVVISRRRLYN